MPHRACLTPGCPRFSSYRGRCDKCKTGHDRSINRAGKKVYASKRWAILRRRKLFINPICETPECPRLALHVHHKHGVENDPWSLEGLEALCESCHNRLTRRTQLERA